MRNNFYTKTAVISLAVGFFAGIFSAIYSAEETADIYGAWLPGFYNCENWELWAKTLFSGPVFVLVAFAVGFFILGYLFVYPIAFYYSYTFGFIFTSTVICFGTSELIHLFLKLPSFAATGWILCRMTSAAVKFSVNAFSGLDYKELRTKTSAYLVSGIGTLVLAAFPLVYDAYFVPKILNLWDSF